MLHTTGVQYSATDYSAVLQTTCVQFSAKDYMCTVQCHILHVYSTLSLLLEGISAGVRQIYVQNTPGISASCSRSQTHRQFSYILVSWIHVSDHWSN